jgi:hypothetical protein
MVIAATEVPPQKATASNFSSARRVLLVLVAAMGWMGGGPLYAEQPPEVPDLIHGGAPDQTHDWTLGPTGARGWIWG